MEPWSDSKLHDLSPDELTAESRALEDEIREIKHVRRQIARELDRRVAENPPEPSAPRQIVTPVRVESEAKVGGLRRFFGG